MFEIFKKKVDTKLEEQTQLFNILEVGDIFWARMSLDEEQENRIEESHKKRPFLMIGKDDDVYALALTTKYYPNGYYPITKKKYHNLKRDSYIEFREISVITKDNLESFSFKLYDDDLNSVVKLYNILKERGNHSLEINYQTKFSLGDLVDYNGKKYLIYKIENDKIYTIRLNYSIEETSLKFGSVHYDTNFKVKIFKNENLKLEGLCNNLVFEKLKKEIDRKIPIIREENLEVSENDLNNCLKVIRFNYLDNNEVRTIYVNTLTFSATKAYGNISLDSEGIFEIPFISYEVIRDLTNEEKRKLILNTRDEILRSKCAKIDAPFKKYKDEVQNIDIYKEGDIFHYKNKLYVLYKKENGNLYTIKLKKSSSSNWFIDDKKYKLSNVKRKFTINDSFDYVGFHNISKLENKVNEIDQNGTFIELGSIININGEDLIVIYQNGNEIWGISNIDNPVLKRIVTNTYSFVGDVSIKNLKKLKQLLPNLKNLLPSEVKYDNKEKIKFGDIISFMENDKITNLIILKKEENKFYGIKNLENPEVYKYKLYKNRYERISQVSNEMLVKLKKIYDDNISTFSEDENFRKGK